MSGDQKKVSKNVAYKVQSFKTDKMPLSSRKQKEERRAFPLETQKIIETDNDMAVNQEMMVNNYFSADVQSSQYSLNNYNSSSRIQLRKDSIKEQHVPKLFNKKSVNLVESKEPSKKKHLVTKRNSHQVQQVNAINYVQKGYKSPPLKIISKYTDSVTKKRHDGSLPVAAQLSKQNNIMNWSRNGSVERMQGDQDDHNQDSIDIVNLKSPEMVLPQKQKLRHRNQKNIYQNSDNYKNGGEDIYESGIYLSNQPNQTNIGTKTALKLFSKLNNNDGSKTIQEGKNNIDSKQIFEVPNPNYDLVLDDPFKEQELNDFQEFDNSDTYQSKQYKTVGQHYKSLGSLHRSSQNQNQKSPVKNYASLSIKSQSEIIIENQRNRVNYLDQLSPSQEDMISIPNSMSSGSRIKTETSQNQGQPPKSKLFNMMSNYHKGDFQDFQVSVQKQSPPISPQNNFSQNLQPPNISNQNQQIQPDFKSLSKSQVVIRDNQHQSKPKLFGFQRQKDNFHKEQRERSMRQQRNVSQKNNNKFTKNFQPQVINVNLHSESEGQSPDNVQRISQQFRNNAVKFEKQLRVKSNSPSFLSAQRKDIKNQSLNQNSLQNQNLNKLLKYKIFQVKNIVTQIDNNSQSQTCEIDDQEFTSDNNVSDIVRPQGLEIEDLVSVGEKNIPKKSNYSKMPTLSRMNQTVGKLQINNLLLKNKGSQPINDYKIDISKSKNQLVSDDLINAPRTHRQFETFTKRIAREGELSLSDENEEITSSSHFDRSMQGDIDKISNCTEERNFTPGQKQFKSFLRLTADRNTIDKSLDEIQNPPQSISKIKGDLNLQSRLKLQLENLNSQMDKNQVRSQTSQILSKQALTAQQQQTSKHLKTKSQITQNRMSPTPQPIPIEIFSQTNSGLNLSPDRNKSPLSLSPRQNLVKIKMKSFQHPSESDDANYNSSNNSGEVEFSKDSANLSINNISGEAEQIDENTQNLSGIFQQFIIRNDNFQFKKNSSSNVFRNENPPSKSSEISSMILSPFDPKAHHIQPFSTNQKNFQREEKRFFDGNSIEFPQRESIESENNDQPGQIWMQNSQGRQLFENNKGVSSLKLNNSSISNKLDFQDLISNSIQKTQFNNQSKLDNLQYNQKLYLNNNKESKMGAEQSNEINLQQQQQSTNFDQNNQQLNNPMVAQSHPNQQTRIESNKLQMKDFPSQYGKIELNLHTDSIKPNHQSKISQSTNSNLKSTGSIPQKHLSQRDNLHNRSTNHVLNSQTLISSQKQILNQQKPDSFHNSHSTKKVKTRKHPNSKDLNTSNQYQKLGKTKMNTLQVLNSANIRSNNSAFKQGLQEKKGQEIQRGHSRQASQVILDNELIDVENEGNADLDADENLEGQNDSNQTHFIQMRSIRALTRSPRDNAQSSQTGTNQYNYSNQLIAQDVTENAKWLNYEDPEVEDDEENQVGASSNGSDDRTQNFDHLPKNAGNQIASGLVHHSGEEAQKHMPPKIQNVQQYQVQNASFLGKRYSNYQQNMSDQNHINVTNLNNSMRYAQNLENQLNLHNNEANIMTEESGPTQHPHFKSRQTESSYKNNAHMILKPSTNETRPGINSAQNTSNHQSSQQQPQSQTRRQTRIKSLYATTTQDLSLDLQRINQELKNGGGVDSESKQAKGSSGSFKQGKPGGKERVKSSARRKNFFVENKVSKQDSSSFYNQNGIANDSDQVIKNINQSQSHQFIGGTKKNTAVNLSNSKQDPNKSQKSRRKGSNPHVLQHKSSKKKLSTILQKNNSHSKQNKTNKAGHSLEGRTGSNFKQKFVSPDKGHHKSGSQSFLNNSAEGDRSFQKNNDSKNRERGTSIAQIFDKIAVVVNNITSQGDESNVQAQGDINSYILSQQQQKQEQQTTGSNSKIQDIKQSSSKLTMAAQLQKYKQDANNQQMLRNGGAGGQASSGCYSPKFQKPNQVYLQNMENNAQIKKSRKAMVNTGSFHPRTTKNNQNSSSTRFGELYSIESPNQKKTGSRQTVADPRVAKQLSRRQMVGQHPRSARGATETRPIINHQVGSQDDSIVISVHNNLPIQKDIKTITQTKFNFENTSQEQINQGDSQNLKSNFRSQNNFQISDSQVQYQTQLKSIKEQMSEMNSTKRKNNERLSFMEQISEKFEELIDFNNQSNQNANQQNPKNSFQAHRDTRQEEYLIGSIQSSQVNKSQIKQRERKHASHAHTPLQIIEKGRKPIQLNLQIDSSEGLRKTHMSTDHYDQQEERQQGKDNLPMPQKQVHEDKDSVDQEIGLTENADVYNQNNLMSAPDYLDEKSPIDMQDLIANQNNQNVSLDIEMQQTIDFNKKKMPQAHQAQPSRIENNGSILTTRGPTGNNIKISEAVKKHQKSKKQDMVVQNDDQDGDTLKNLPFNGCSCNHESGLQQQKKGCINTQKWLRIAWKEDNFQHLSNFKMYQLYIEINDKSDKQVQIEQDITMDLERTFQHLPYFQSSQIKDSLRRILIAFSNYEPQVGYVQGMNFIAAVLLYHSGEVAAFWLLCALMETYNLKHVLCSGLPGLPKHDEQIEKQGREQLPKLFKHFDDNFVTTNLFSTDWIISLFLNFIPIEFTNIYLDLFFEKSWEVFYDVAIAILRFYEQDLIRMHDPGQIIGQIKQARLGCEHLLMFGSSQQSSYRKNQSLNNITVRESEANVRNSQVSGIPFSVINLVQNDDAENVKNSTILDDSRSDFMAGDTDVDIYGIKGNARSHSMIPKNKYGSNQKSKHEDEQKLTGTKSNAMLLKNVEMWTVIINDVRERSTNQTNTSI